MKSVLSIQLQHIIKEPGCRSRKLCGYALGDFKAAIFEIENGKAMIGAPIGLLFANSLSWITTAFYGRLDMDLTTSTCKMWWMQLYASTV